MCSACLPFIGRIRCKRQKSPTPASVQRRTVDGSNNALQWPIHRPFEEITFSRRSSVEQWLVDAMGVCFLLLSSACSRFPHPRHGHHSAVVCMIRVLIAQYDCLLCEIWIMFEYIYIQVADMAYSHIDNCGFSGSQRKCATATTRSEREKKIQGSRMNSVMMTRGEWEKIAMQT